MSREGPMKTLVSDVIVWHGADAGFNRPMNCSVDIREVARDMSPLWNYHSFGIMLGILAYKELEKVRVTSVEIALECGGP